MQLCEALDVEIIASLITDDISLRKDLRASFLNLFQQLYLSFVFLTINFLIYNYNAVLGEVFITRDLSSSMQRQCPSYCFF